MPPAQVNGRREVRYCSHAAAGADMEPWPVYRERSEQCLILAEMMTDPAARVAMLQAAFQWKALAEMVDRYALSEDDGPDGKPTR